MPTGSYARPTIAERFWPKVDKSGDCWVWTGANQAEGRYGRIWRGTGYVYAHRVSWELANGRGVPSGMFVCHTCDNPICVRPEHLFLGSPAANNADRDAKGRTHTGRPPRGEANHQARLTAALAAEIRARYVPRVVTARKLAAEYGVSKRTILSVVHGRHWSE